MRRLHPIFGLLLAAILALNSVTQAVARGQMAGGLAVEICGTNSDSGSFSNSSPGFRPTTTVTLDVSGQPLRPMHHCPDCLSGVSLATADCHALTEPPTGRACRMPWPAPNRMFGSAAPQPSARGPPLWI